MLAVAFIQDSLMDFEAKSPMLDLLEISMKLKYAILYVEDVPATLDFYEQAFGLTRKMLHEGGDYGELDTGTTFHFRSHHSR